MEILNLSIHEMELTSHIKGRDGVVINLVPYLQLEVLLDQSYYEGGDEEWNSLNA